MDIQGSLLIKRLRTGDNINLYLSADKDLYQGVDTGTGTVAPNWATAANQPTITPSATSVKGASVALSSHTWKNGGSAIAFGTTATDGWVTSTTPSGTYKMNTSTGALKICKNLASTSNVGNDILTYTGLATVNGVEYTLSKDITVRIQTVGASSYEASVSTTRTTIDANNTSAVLSVRLFLGTTEQTTYYTKWYKDTEYLSSLSSSAKTLTVTRDDVEGSQLYICQCYSDSARTKLVAQHGVVIYDDADEYKIRLNITSSNLEVDTDKPVTVVASVLRNGDVYTTPSNAVWRTDVCDEATFAVLKTNATNTIQVTTTETDRNNKESNVIVISEVQF